MDTVNLSLGAQFDSRLRGRRYFVAWGLFSLILDCKEAVILLLEVCSV
jgi:hypothetical protein